MSGRQLRRDRPRSLVEEQALAAFRVDRDVEAEACGGARLAEGIEGLDERQHAIAEMEAPAPGDELARARARRPVIGLAVTAPRAGAGDEVDELDEAARLM